MLRAQEVKSAETITPGTSRLNLAGAPTPLTSLEQAAPSAPPDALAAGSGGDASTSVDAPSAPALTTYGLFDDLEDIMDVDDTTVQSGVASPAAQSSTSFVPRSVVPRPPPVPTAAVPTAASAPRKSMVDSNGFAILFGQGSMRSALARPRTS